MIVVNSNLRVAFLAIWEPLSFQGIRTNQITISSMSVSVINANLSRVKFYIVKWYLIGLPFEHSWLGLEAWWPGKIKQNTKSSSCTWSTWLHLPPGSLHQRGQVWSAGPVLPGVRLLHDGEQHDDDELARDHPGDAALEEGLPLNLQQSRPGRDTLSNFCRLLISGSKPNMAMFSTSNCFQEVAEICFLRLNLLLVAVEARKYEGGSIDINPNGKKITPNAIGLFISDSSDKVKRAWFYCRLVFEAKKLHSYSFLVVCQGVSREHQKPRWCEEMFMQETCQGPLRIFHLW